MKRLIIMIAAAALLAPAAAGAQDRDRNREEQSERISRTLKIGAGGELDLANLSGDIIVKRGSGSAVQLEAVKIAHARTAADAREMLALVSVDIQERGSRAEVRAVYPRHEERNRGNRNINVSVQFNITAPEGLSIGAHTLSGNITVTDIKGDLNLTSLSGNVKIFNGARVMTAKSTSGNVEIANLRSETALAVSTVSGNLLIRQSRVPRMEIGTVSGNLVITDVECDRVEANALSGDLEFSSPLARNGRYELNSHSGVIRVLPTGNTGFELVANSFSGSIESTLALTDQREGGADYGRRRANGRRRSLRGVYGDGSAVLDITTFSGNVIIGKK